MNRVEFLKTGTSYSKDGHDQAGIEPTKERRCYNVAETTTNVTRESASSWRKE